MNATTRRLTSRMEGEYVVFLIGMRMNAWWKIWKWLPIAFGMQRMLRELTAHPELGFLGGESWGGRTTLLVSYWRSKEQLLAFASRPSSTHLPAWRAFYRALGSRADVGIWHETYVVAPGAYENVYVNMPAFGLGKVGRLVEASGPNARAAGRLTSSGARAAPATATSSARVSACPEALPSPPA